jgi:uncharacterized protein
MIPSAVALAVIAKEPIAGRAKTRLCPPLRPEQAATLAEAALADTLAAVAATPAYRRVLVLDGRPGDWLRGPFEVIAQGDGGLDRRLASAFEAVGGPALVVGMDTPQLSPSLIGAGARALAADGCDAVLGPAADGGYWAIGLRRPSRVAIAGVPMSVPWTAAAQRARLRALGLRCTHLPELRDVDTYEDARAVAATARATRFARRLAAIESGWRADSAVAGAG